MSARSRISPESRVVLRFLGAWSVLTLLGFQARGLNGALDLGLARLLGASLNLLHIPAMVVSTIVLFGSRNLRVADPCNGLQLLEILLKESIVTKHIDIVGRLQTKFCVRWRQNSESK